MADSEDVLLKQLTKNLYDYEDDDLTDDQSKGVVQVAYEIIKRNQKEADPVFAQQMKTKLATYGDSAKLNLALIYLLNRNQQKYGGGGLFGAFLDAITSAFS